MRSTDFSPVVSPLSGYASGGRAKKRPALVVVMEAPLSTPRRHFAQGGVNSDASMSYGGMAANPVGALSQNVGGYFPNNTTLSNQLGYNPMMGSLATTLLGFALPPLGMAMIGYNAIANGSNTLNNAGMLGQAGDPQGIGQVLGGLLGMNSLAGTAGQALNGAENTQAGRLALDTPQAQGELPGVNLPTQTAPVTPVTSQNLAAPPGMDGGGGDSGGGGPGVTGGNPGVGEGGAGVAGGGSARGGRFRARRAA